MVYASPAAPTKPSMSQAQKDDNHFMTALPSSPPSIIGPAQGDARSRIARWIPSSAHFRKIGSSGIAERLGIAGRMKFRLGDLREGWRYGKSGSERSRRVVKE